MAIDDPPEGVQVPRGGQRKKIEQVFIEKKDRPDLSIDLDSRVSELRIRDLATILGSPIAARSASTMLNKTPAEIPPNLKIKLLSADKGLLPENITKRIKDGKDQWDDKLSVDTFTLGPTKIGEPGKGPREVPSDTFVTIADIDELVKRVSGLPRDLERLKRAVAKRPRR